MLAVALGRELRRRPGPAVVAAAVSAASRGLRARGRALRGARGSALGRARRGLPRRRLPARAGGRAAPGRDRPLAQPALRHGPRARAARAPVSGALRATSGAGRAPPLSRALLRARGVGRVSRLALQRDPLLAPARARVAGVPAGAARGTLGLGPSCRRVHSAEDRALGRAPGGAARPRRVLPGPLRGQARGS